MSHHEPEAVAAPDLLTASSAAIGALAGAIDDLHRAGLILRQLASGASQQIRGPEDYCRIAGQFSDRARLCRAAEDALLAACRPAQASTTA
jgi:hypothetical protein